MKNYLVAELDSSYELPLSYLETLKARVPKYDLRHFANNIPKNLPTVKMSGLIEASTMPIKTTSTQWLDNKYLIWTIIGIVGTVLAFISFSMIKEMGKKERENRLTNSPHSQNFHVCN